MWSESGKVVVISICMCRYMYNEVFKVWDIYRYSYIHIYKNECDILLKIFFMLLKAAEAGRGEEER